MDLTDIAPGLLFISILRTSYHPPSDEKNSRYHLPPSLTTTPFPSKVYAVGSFLHVLRISFHFEMAG